MEFVMGFAPLTKIYETVSAPAKAAALGAAIAFSPVAANAEGAKLVPAAVTLNADQISAINTQIDKAYDHSRKGKEIGIIMLVGTKDRESGWTPKGMGDALEGILKKDENVESKAFGIFVDQPDTSITYTFVPEYFESMGPFSLNAAAGYTDEAAERFGEQSSYFQDNNITLAGRLDLNQE